MRSGMKANTDSTNEGALLSQLIHNGILIPHPPDARGLVLTVRGTPVRLTPTQEEMALAWAKKQGTPYVEDEIFVRNFMRDFSTALDADSPLAMDNVDFSPALQVVQAEREAKAAIAPEQRKVQAAARKAEREELREQFGYALVNGERIELGTYLVEPSGIFMGRGEHPLRGRWKQGAQQSDITLNLSPDAPRPSGDWDAIVWEPNGLWVARWKDRLSGKLKYIWLGETASVRQAREAGKFDKAIALSDQLAQVREAIEREISGPEPKRRMIAVACYLIDRLGLRVGDEKDSDEADTVGATTLRPEHVRLLPDLVAEFRFLGKDSVAWHKSLKLPSAVYTSLQELIAEAHPPTSHKNTDRYHPTRNKPQIFPDISSHDVNAFLSELSPGLTAKVFRTYHATHLVRESLAAAKVKPKDPVHEKWLAASLANVRAAEFCNHTKKPSGSWENRREAFRVREHKAEERVQKARASLQAKRQNLHDMQQQSREQVAAVTDGKQRDRKAAAWAKKLSRVGQQIRLAEQQLHKAELALGKLKAQMRVTREKRNWNLNTSLKSYIDPRVMHSWGLSVDYDVLDEYYPTTLRRKFSWVDLGPRIENQDDDQG